MQQAESVTPTAENTEAPSETLEQTESESSESEQQESEGETAPKAKESQAAKVRRLAENDLDAVVTVKVNGEEKELTVREVMKLQQLEKASQNKMQEASKLAGQAKALWNLAKTNPREFLKQTGIDPDEFAESTLAEKFELMKMTPEQKRLKEFEEKEKKWQEREKSEKEAKEKEELGRIEAQEMEVLDSELGSALGEVGISAEKYGYEVAKQMTAQIAFRVLSASRQNKSLTAKQAAVSVKAEFDDAVLKYLEKTDVETIQSKVSKEWLKKFRDSDVKRVSGNLTSQNSTSPGSKPASSAKKTFTSEYEWREHIKKMASNLRD